MKKHRSVLLAAMVMASGLVQAHTHLQTSSPADNSVVTSSPAQLVLNFSEATRLTAVSIEKEGSSESNSVGELPKDSSQALTVPLGPLGAGRYLVKWRALGADKHVMSGTLHFSVANR